jgi:hypothetical protein
MNRKATWYEGEGRLLAQWLFGRVYPLASLESGSPETYRDLLKVATLLNKHLTQKRIEILIDILAEGIKKYNKEHTKK